MGFCHLAVTRPWQIPILVPRGREGLGIRLGTALLLAAGPRSEDAEIWGGRMKAQPPRASPPGALGEDFLLFRSGEEVEKAKLPPPGGFTASGKLGFGFHGDFPLSASSCCPAPRGLGPPSAVSHPALGKSRGRNGFFGCPPDARNSWKQRSNKGWERRKANPASPCPLPL